MNRNIPAFTAVMLAIAIVAAFCGGLFVKNSVGFAEADEKAVYLTFDDGPSDKVTPLILDVLKEENVKATFFIVGKHAESRKDLLKRICGEGHALGVHSYSHCYSEIYSSEDALIRDIDRCNEVIKSVKGEYSRLYRFPGGSFGLDKKFLDAVKAHGLEYVDWNASFCDSEIKNATPEQLYDSAVSTSAGARKVIMLAHDSTMKSATAQALKSVIRYFKDKGYKFKTF